MSKRRVAGVSTGKVPGLNQGCVAENDDEQMQYVPIPRENWQEYEQNQKKARLPKSDCFAVSMSNVQIICPLVPKSPWGLLTKVMIRIAKAINGPQADPM
jgi:hypothetical protein